MAQLSIYTVPFDPITYVGCFGSKLVLELTMRQDVYWATLDGVTTIGNGNSNSSGNIFQHSIFSASRLSNDQHTLILQNKYSTTVPSWVDVDYIVVTSGDGNAQ